MKKEKKQKTKEYKISTLQFWGGIWWLVALVMLISVAIAIYTKNDFLAFPYIISYIVVIVIFGLSSLLIVINSIFGMILAKKHNNKKIFILFLLSAILVIPFVSIFAIFASSISLTSYNKYESQTNIS
ncbi:hypothetical protein [Metamycoplasma auris]|uniref:Uncharacterized protein n=1 Tax=Metamycoplasma auris TaxID=51363 RepID=A0A2W7G6E2_9BACT|nr:hypothetical protein [Metamycoplasma auris]PZW01504.1 hypothetical protein BCF89_10119 [Metamycoplasma auris]